MTSKDLLKVSVALTVLAAAGSAFAASGAITGTTTIGNGTFTPSANVRLDVAADDAHYAATSQHFSGDRIFFGNNSDSKIYYSTKTTGATTSTSLDPSTAAPSSWSSL